MAFFLSDANGYLGDFATHQGLRDLLAKTQLPVLQNFLREGVADKTLMNLLIVELDKDADTSLDYIAEMLHRATPPVIIDDGVGEDDG